MKVILINGSTRPQGCTYTGLKEVARALEAEGIETELFQIGAKPLAGCYGCGKCAETKRCFIDDTVNEFLGKAETADGFVFGTPVHFAGASGALTSFMDRAFYGKGHIFRYKPAAVIASCRRGGASATLDQINKYFGISCMPVVSSKYWNMIHGNTPEEVVKDEEGMQTMRELGKNMAWLLKCINAGTMAGISRPVMETPVKTNFIR